LRLLSLILYCFSLEHLRLPRDLPNSGRFPTFNLTLTTDPFTASGIMFQLIPAIFGLAVQGGSPSPADDGGEGAQRDL
jgi:hypothetical protein